MLLMSAINANDPWQSICSASVDKRFTNANTRVIGTWRRRLPMSASKQCSAIGRSPAERPVYVHHTCFWSVLCLRLNLHSTQLPLWTNQPIFSTSFHHTVKMSAVFPTAIYRWLSAQRYYVHFLMNLRFWYWVTAWVILQSRKKMWNFKTKTKKMTVLKQFIILGWVCKGAVHST